MMTMSSKIQEETSEIDQDEEFTMEDIIDAEDTDGITTDEE